MKYIGFQIDINTFRVIDHEELIFDEPCAIAYDANKKVLAIGHDAIHYIGQTRVVYPLKQHDVQAFTLFLDCFLEDYTLFHFFTKTTIIASYPSFFSSEDLEMIQTHLILKGASKVVFEHEDWLACKGTRVPLHTSIPTCFFFLTAEECQLHIYQENERRFQSKNDFGMNQLILYVRRWIRNQMRLEVSDQSIDALLTEIGYASTPNEPHSYALHGFDIKTQQMNVVTLTPNQIVHVLNPIIVQWTNWIYQFLMNLDPKYTNQISSQGILCCGDFVTVQNIHTALSQQLQIPFYIAKDPQYTILTALKDIIRNMED